MLTSDLEVSLDDPDVDLVDPEVDFGDPEVDLSDPEVSLGDLIDPEVDLSDLGDPEIDLGGDPEVSLGDQEASLGDPTAASERTLRAASSFDEDNQPKHVLPINKQVSAFLPGRAFKRSVRNYAQDGGSHQRHCRGNGGPHSHQR